MAWQGTQNRRDPLYKRGPFKSSWRILWSLLALGLASACALWSRGHRQAMVGMTCGASMQPVRLSQLLALPGSLVNQCDIALLNLLCTEGLTGAEDVRVQDCFTRLDEWVQHVKSETERHLYRFNANPGEFDYSEGYFRMLMMAVILYEDYGIRYNPARITTPDSLGANDCFFADSRDLFLHGLLGPSLNPQGGSTRPRLGTCSSMPVLYVALGRRLGYPLKLVTTKAHLFIRWESPTERFNLEATGKGMNRYDDEHFKRWPFPVSEEEIQADGYLKSLTPAEELALFLSLRGHCLREAGRLPEAIASYAEAVRLAPASRPYRRLLADARQGSAGAPPAGQPGSGHGTSPAGDARPVALLPPPASIPVAETRAQPDPNPLLRIRQQ